MSHKPFTLHFFIPIFSVLLFLLASYIGLRAACLTRIYVDGKIIENYSITKSTPAKLLKRHKIDLGPLDFTEPRLEEKIRWGEHVRVVRVHEEKKEEKEVGDFVLEWKRRTATNLRLVELQRGYHLEKFWLNRKLFHNGKEVTQTRDLLHQKKILVDRIVLFKKNREIEKIYSTYHAKKFLCVATAYWIGDPQVPGTETFGGHQVERGLVAVDPRVIPLGWRIYVPGYGYGYTDDTGSAIKGHRIDLFVENKEASRRWEYVRTPVYLLEKAKYW